MSLLGLREIELSLDLPPIKLPFASFQPVVIAFESFLPSLKFVIAGSFRWCNNLADKGDGCICLLISGSIT